MRIEDKEEKNKPLRIISRKLYEDIITELGVYNIHSYDVLIEGQIKEKGIHLIMQFGEDYKHGEEVFFSFETIEKKDIEIANFLKGIAEKIKEVMVADYFKMMAP